MSSAPAISPTAAGAANRVGLAHWMERVLQELDKAAVLDPDPVHDLRVALRRCRSMAQGFQDFDSYTGWKKMRKAGKAIFAPLGELRDTQVLIEWAKKLAPADDSATQSLLKLFDAREKQQKAQAAVHLQDFDRKQWRQWARELPARSALVPEGSVVFEYLALKNWEQARNFHRLALRDRTPAAFHRLRISLKKLRYVVENFLPAHHQRWGGDLKQVQDLLGEVHDLDLLWIEALRGGVFEAAPARIEWRRRIVAERARRLDAYRHKMVGENSLWPVWRAELPQGEQLEEAILARFDIMIRLRGADVAHARRVTRISLNLYNGLISAALMKADQGKPRRLLHAAALLHAIGGSGSKHKRNPNHSAKAVRKLEPPLGWTRDDFEVVAEVVRYQRGKLPAETQNHFRALSPGQRQLTCELAAVLRLAEALAETHAGRITRMNVRRTSETVQLRVPGYVAANPDAEKIAAARCLLEQVTALPVVVTPAS